MARDDPLDDGLTKSLFSGISRPRPGSQKPEDGVQSSPAEVQASEAVERSSASVIQTPSSEVHTTTAGVQTSAPLIQSSVSAVQSPEAEVRTSSPELHSSGSDIQSSEDDKRTSVVQTSEVDMDALDQALQEAERYPKVTAYSPELAAVMRYNEITVRRYRISTEAAKMLEDHVKEKYPEIWSEVSKRIQHKKRRK